MWAPSHNFDGLYLRNYGTYRQPEKNLLSSNTSSTCPHNMENFGPLTTEIGLPVWAPLQITTGFASWQCYCTASSSGHQPNLVALNRGRHLYSAGRPSRWALAHISSCPIVYSFFLSFFLSFIPVLTTLRLARMIFIIRC